MIENKSNKGKWMTVQQKYEVICQHQRHLSLSTAKLAEWARREFGLQHPPPSRETVRLILKTADSIIEKRKTASTPKGKKLCVRCPQLESELGRFVQGCNAQFVCLSRRLLQTKARRILAKTPTAPALKLSSGWLTRFKSGYRDEHMQLAVDRADEDSPETTPEGKNIYWVDQLQAMWWSKEVWARISAATIANCFRHSGVVFGDPVKAPERRDQVLMSDVLL